MRTWTKIVAVVVLPALITLLPGCGGDDEEAYEGSVSVRVNPEAIEEGQQIQFIISLSRRNNSGRAVEVPFIMEGTAENGIDYEIAASPARVNDGATQTVLQVRGTNDVLLEGQEMIIMRLDSSGFAEGLIPGESTSALVTISDDDSREVNLLTTNATGAEGSNNASFTIRLDRPAQQALTIGYLMGGTATAGTDYEAVSGEVTIPLGAPSSTVDIIVLDDEEVEDIEFIEVSLDMANLPDGLTQGQDTTITLRIQDDDEAPYTARVGVIASTASGTEGGTDGAFTVSLDQANTSGVSILIPYVLSGSAQNGVDYQELGGTAEITIGNSEVIIPVNIVDDGVPEGNESVVLIIDTSNLPTGITATTSSSATVTIIDND